MAAKETGSPAIGCKRKRQPDTAGGESRRINKMTERRPAMASRYIALIPAYEPDRKMLGVIADLGKTGFDVVVVDDGSGPEYAELFEQAAERLPGKSGRGVTLLIHDVNRGKGAALKTGLDFINNFMVVRGEEKQNIIVAVDADGQHLAIDALRAAYAAQGNPGTLVLGSRILNNKKAAASSGEQSADPASGGRNQSADRADSGRDRSADSASGGKVQSAPLRSRFGNAVTRQVFRLATGVPVYDTQTGLRAFTADLIPALLAVNGDRYEYELNVLMDFAGRGIPIREIEIETVYLDGNKSSHFDTVRDSYRIYKEIAKYAVTGGRSLHGGAAPSQTYADQMRKGAEMSSKSGQSAHGIKGAAKQAAKFSASSFASFLIDYAVYALLLMIGPGLVFANIGARLVSSTANYTINRKLVFRSGKKVATSAVQYFALAAFILAGNTFVLHTMVTSLGINSMAAKVLTEVLFFMISWTVQRYVVFYDSSETNGSEADRSKSVITGDRGTNSLIGDLGRTEWSDGKGSRFQIGYTAVRPKKLKAVRSREATRAEA